MTQQKPLTVQELAQQRLQEEALSVAKSIQAPGQTKEQTKLIAKGIEKGIAAYKQQQKAKARELDRAKKKALKLKSQGSATEDESDNGLEDDELPVSATKPALLVAGAIFSFVALIHALRYGLGWSFIFNRFEIPMSWSLAAVFVAAGLAIWMFRVAKD
jgi:hypothetical protein